MVEQHQNITTRIKRVRSRWQKMVALQGTAQVLLVTMIALGIVLLLDVLIQLDPVIRFILMAATVGIFLTVLFFKLIRPLTKLPSEIKLARYLEEKHPELEDRLVTAVEFGGRQDPKISTEMLEKLLDDARYSIAPLKLRKSVTSKAPVLWSSVAVAAGVILAAFVFSNLESFALLTNRILTPWKFPNIQPKPALFVSPGDARVRLGVTQEIQAEVTGIEPEVVLVYYTSDDSSWNRMEMEAGIDAGSFSYNLFDLDRDTKYYVKADDRLSDIYNLTVYEAPRIKRVDLVYTYPEYTGLQPKTEIDTGDIWAPEGTKVKITAVADKPLSKAEIMVEESDPLRTTISQDTLVTAWLTINADTWYKILVTDRDKLSNAPAPEFYVHALPDQPPVLTLEKPGRDIKASMVEEVPLHVRIEDDYGHPALQLLYTINGSEEKVVDLKTTKEPSGGEGILHEFTADHLFYLEDANVQPGDFLTYYVRTKGGTKKKFQTTSEIFFIEVRPFEQAYYRALSQGNMGGNGQGIGRLSQTQKEIIIATWKVNQRKDKLEPAALAEDAGVITESQKNLLEVTRQALMQMQQRALFSQESGIDATKHYEQAVDAMQRAVDELEPIRLTQAMTPEKEALSALLAAEALLKDIQVQQGQGAGNSASLQELSELFEQEMDKLSNKYETLKRNEQRRDDEEINDALQKIKELAKRQQLFNQRMQELARKKLPEEEKKRQIEELKRQQEDIRRQTQELARQMQQMQQQNNRLPQEIQDNLKRATSEMRNASNNLSGENAEMAAAKGTQALNKLKQLEDLLQRNQKESLRRQIDELEQEFQRTAEAQNKLSRELQSLSGEDQQLEDKLEQAHAGQNQIKNDLANAQEQLTSLSKQARAAQSDVSREINRLQKELEQMQLEKKMEQAQNLMEQKQLEPAKNIERDLANKMEQIGEEMTRLRGSLAETAEEKLDLALNQTRRVREKLESLQRQQSGKQAGEQTEQAATEGDGQQSKSGPGENRKPGQRLDPELLNRFNEELAESLSDLEFIKKSVKLDSSLSREARQLSQNLQGALRTFNGGQPERWQTIENQVLAPLKEFEAELTQILELLKNKEKLFLAKDEQIPEAYRELVEKYYEALSRTN